MSMRRAFAFALFTGLLGWGWPAAADDAAALEIFKQRITPILRSPKASSCAECHLSGVDLKNYIGETQEASFAALKAAGLVDLQNPDKSKILQFIQRTPDKPTPVSQKVRQQEFEAFQAWIRAAVKDPQLAAAKTDSDQLGPSVSVEVIRHTRQDRIVASFTENIWSEMGRCVSCHSPELNRNKIGKNGLTKEDVDAISWVVPRDPAATLQKLVDSSNIDLDNPDKSPVLTKAAGLEKHGGGPKFAVGSRTDKNFRRFLNDYAASVQGKYQKTEQLPQAPAMSAAATGQHLKITNLPAGLGGKLLRADIYRWTGAGWSDAPVALGENPIAPKQPIWQSLVFALAPRSGPPPQADQPLPAGRYLIKVYIDRQNKTKENRDYELGADEFVAQVETDGEWKPGFQPPKIVSLPKP